jgi:hypothetical protein
VTEFQSALVEAAWAELQQQRRRSERSRQTVDDEIDQLKRRADHLAEAISRVGNLDSLVGQLAKVEKELQGARQRRTTQTPGDPSDLGLDTRADVERHLTHALQEVARNSFAFADLMRRIIPEFLIQPVQALDSGLVRPRARLVLRLAALAERPGTSDPTLPQAGDVAMVLDLFEPPKHIAAIPACVAAKRSDPQPTLDDIANRLGLNRMTVKRALDYSRRMQAEGLAEPYRELRERPASASRWKPREVS